MRVQGLVVPPRVAVTQAVVVPIPSAKLSAEQHAAISAKAAEIYGALVGAGVRTHLDDRDNYTPGWKYNHWELKARRRLLFSNPNPDCSTITHCFMQPIGHVASKWATPENLQD